MGFCSVGDDLQRFQVVAPDRTGNPATFLIKSALSANMLDLIRPIAAQIVSGLRSGVVTIRPPWYNTCSSVNAADMVYQEECQSPVGRPMA